MTITATTKQTHRYRKQRWFPGVGGEGHQRGGKWEVHATVCKAGCKDVLYNMGNTVNILS